MKKALLVGINKYQQPGTDLRGCVNDVVNMRKLLNEVYKFPLDNIRVLTDYRATKQGILERLHWLIDGAAVNDELVFHFSGHGSQVRDRSGDELQDRLDEILCPTDLNWNDPLTDDIIGAIFKSLPPSRYLTMICDSCHSGSMTRSFFENPELEDPKAPKDRFMVPPIDIQARSEGRELVRSNIGMKQNKGGKPVDQKHILLSGCQDHQTSADAFIDGTYQGALTATLIKVLRSNPNMDCNNVHRNTVNILRKSGFSQIPNLSGNKGIRNRKIFGGV